jgi:transposase-like protein
MPKGKRHSSEFKFRVALEAATGNKTLAQLSSEFSLHSSQISEWKGRLMEEGDRIFDPGAAHGQREQEMLQTELYEQIGRLQMELEWLKKSVTAIAASRRRSRRHLIPAPLQVGTEIVPVMAETPHDLATLCFVPHGETLRP